MTDGVPLGHRRRGLLRGYRRGCYSSNVKKKKKIPQSKTSTTMLWRLGLFSKRGCFSRKSSSSGGGGTPKDGLSKAVHDALTQLEGVTEKRDAQSGEAADTECPICLGCLFASEEQQQQQTSSPSPSPRDAAKVDLEAGKGGVLRPTTTESTVTSSDNEKTKQQQQQPINDEVLKMKRCTHMFHARCLVTWFMNKKYECPVCRTVYYQPPLPPSPSSSSSHSSPAEASGGPAAREERDEEYWYRREQDEYMYRQQLAYSIMPFF
ncbi:hypothetical protein F4775DRAFT_133830 [Biscogniauxia sp. FL1348]|nr:hypothetical protein F4775DRAFT_133830 [Biscogniauxia sp. FL1348]